MPIEYPTPAKAMDSLKAGACDVGVRRDGRISNLRDRFFSPVYSNESLLEICPNFILGQPVNEREEETDMKIDGGCHCGNITYTAEIAPENVGICHCTDCQTLSGSAFRTSVRASKEAFHLEGGQPKIYVKTAESGVKRAQAFCPECGTSIYSAAVSDPQVFNIRVGTARQRAELRPRSQGWCRSARDWVMDLQSVKQFAKQRSG